MAQARPLRPSHLGKFNEREILRIVQSQGPQSRADLVRSTGLSAPTVSKAVASLLKAGLLEELEAPQAQRGRPAPIVQLASQTTQVLGLVIDAGHCKLVSAGLDGVLHPEQFELPTPATYPELIQNLGDACEKLLTRPGIVTLGLGISIPGLIDNRHGVGVLSPNLKLTDRQRPAADLEKRLGIPAVLIQEAHALCLAEWHYGLAVGMENFAVLDFGVGVGVGVMMAGQLMLGQHGFAGEIGHITVVSKDGEACGCGNRGCLETVCNDAAFARRVSRQLHRSVSMDEALHLLETGRAPLGNVLRETAEFFSIACAAVINLFNPKSLFVQSQLLRRDPRLFDTIQQLIRTRALRPMLEECTIDLARGNKMQGAVAAIVRHLTNAVIGTE